ncbi:PglZ domain-containing protein [Halomarina pelagica]|uniref:PglZ domain-containing protein n=1 Tax=Halomarina pelagica TaxID=2961599 RepID=UPI0020C4B4DA|nr:PglZ domain-containing protein [Halomarina sp. BND7]
MTNTTAEIIADLEERFDRYPVWVWYDSHEKYSNIIDDIETEMEDRGVNVARYDGSFFELKRRLWEEDNDIEEQWLFYIPLWRDEADWFMDIHRLGHQYLPGADIGESAAHKYLVGKEDRIPDGYENWGQNREQLTRAFFCVLFGTHSHSPRDYVVEYLANPDEYRETIEEFNQSAEWGTTLKSDYGIDAGLDAEEIATQILFGEVQHRSPAERFDKLAADDTRGAARLCSYWQRHDTRTYLDFAGRIAEDRNIAGAVVDSDSLDWHGEAFRQIDDGLFQLMLDRLSEVEFGQMPEEAESIAKAVERRRDGFWYEEGFVGYWDILTHGTTVVQSASTAINELESENHTSQSLAEGYTDGWWEIDAEYRRYVQSAMDFRQYVDGLDEVRDRITNYYTRFVKALNRPLADALADEPELGTLQTQFFDEYVANDKGTAVIICDGLRYELAKELEGEIEKGDSEIDLSLGHVSAALPSITEVGMAAHLPGELSLSLQNGDLDVQVAGQEIRRKADRVDRLEAAGFTVSNLSDILGTRKSDLKEEGQPPRVVYSGTIDKLGETLDDDDALVKSAEHVRDVDDVVQRLRAVGYTRFVVTADHGFLYTERLPDDLKIEALDGAKMTKRRFALAESDDVVTAGGEVVEFEANHFDALGIDAPNLRVYFPRSVACFKQAGGNMQYFHGGISMQELAVPCLTIATEEFEEEAPVEYEVTFPEKVTNTIIDIEINARSNQISFERTPTLRLTASVDGREVAEPKVIEINQGGNEETLRLKSGELEEDSTVIFEAIDEETRETVARQEAEIDMLIRDDFGFDV